MTGTASKQDKVRLMTKVAAGAVAGGVAAILALSFLGRFIPDRGDPGTVLALAGGLCYAFMGVLVGVGTLAPDAGATFLNVEDADEIREQGRMLRPSAAACILVGLFLLILAVAPGLAPSMGEKIPAAAAILCLAAIVLITLATKGRYDELTRQIGLEASALTLHLALVVLGGWAALARAGYAGTIRPVALIAALALLELVVIFAVCAKRGLLRPR